MKHYLYKLLPPRPDFAQTMTPNEAQVMGAHVEYWSNLMQQDKVVAFGPVADPKGVYGIGLIRLDDAADPESLASEDPAIKAGLGFKSEIFLMPQLVSKA